LQKKKKCQRERSTLIPHHFLRVDFYHWILWDHVQIKIHIIRVWGRRVRTRGGPTPHNCAIIPPFFFSFFPFPPFLIYFFTFLLSPTFFFGTNFLTKNIIYKNKMGSLGSQIYTCEFHRRLFFNQKKNSKKKSIFLDIIS
jgi:hypothetical protein